MKSSQVDRRFRAAARNIERLESRCLLSATVLSQIPAQAIYVSNGPDAIDLNTYFNDPAITGTVVQITSTLGNIELELFDSMKPASVANFLSYVNSGTYNNTIIHRSGNISDNSNSAAVQVIQGGGFNTSFDSVTPANAVGVTDEASTNGVISNLTGTIAYARGGNPNSATTQWFINTTDNPELDPNPDGSDASSQAGYCVFGEVINGTMATVNAIAAVPRYDISSDNVPNSTALSQLPAESYSQGQANAGIPPDASDLVTLTNVAVIPKLTYAVSSSDSSVVGASVSNGVLTLTPTDSGSANVTVMATDTTGMTVSSSFQVTVSNNNVAAVTIGAGGAKSVTYTDTDGTTGIVTLKGAGSAVVDFSGADLQSTTTKKGVVVTATTNSISSIDTTGTNATSVLAITTKGGTKAVDVGGIDTQTIKSITGTGVTLSGDMTSSGPIGSLIIAGAQAGTIDAPSIGTLTVTGAFSDAMTLSATSGVSLNKFTAGAITGGPWMVSGAATSVTAKSATTWTPDFTMPVKHIAINGNLSGTITATDIGTLNVLGNMSATVNAGAIANLMVRKELTNSAVNLSGAGVNLARLTVAGAISASSINSTGSIGVVSAASLTNSQIFAGINTLPAGQPLPTTLNDFLSSQSIASVRLQTTRTGNSFSNSDIAGAMLGNLSLGTLLTSNGGMSSGVAAQSIKTFNAVANGKHIPLKNVIVGTDLSAVLPLLGDFVITIL